MTVLKPFVFGLLALFELGACDPKISGGALESRWTVSIFGTALSIPSEKGLRSFYRAKAGRETA